MWADSTVARPKSSVWGECLKIVPTRGTACNKLFSCSGHMESILAQSMYFGLSFSRVGADFRPQLAPIFLKAIQNCFDRQLDRTEAEFLHNMKMFHLNDSISLFSTPVASGKLAQFKQFTI